ncbi:hypothetical protein YC2023_023094 [Brassica napus]
MWKSFKRNSVGVAVIGSLIGAGGDAVSSGIVKKGCETVKLVCRDRKTMKEIYIDVAESNKYGKYKFSRVIFNHYNGIALQIRQANNMRFEKDVTDGFCSELFKKYQDSTGAISFTEMTVFLGYIRSPL